MISYGNNFSPMMEAAFDQETKSNLQIKENLAVEYGSDVGTVKDCLSDFKIAKKLRQTEYLVTDKGTDYMRCALKTSMLLNILHLSLPDNLLGHSDIKIIANMIKKNPPMRILNLSHNNFDS
jgi:hypothetical protein